MAIRSMVTLTEDEGQKQTALYRSEQRRPSQAQCDQSTDSSPSMPTPATQMLEDFALAFPIVQATAILNEGTHFRCSVMPLTTPFSSITTNSELQDTTSLKAEMRAFFPFRHSCDYTLSAITFKLSIEWTRDDC